MISSTSIFIETQRNFLLDDINGDNFAWWTGESHRQLDEEKNHLLIEQINESLARVNLLNKVDEIVTFSEVRSNGYQLIDLNSSQSQAGGKIFFRVIEFPQIHLLDSFMQPGSFLSLNTPENQSAILLLTENPNIVGDDPKSSENTIKLKIGTIYKILLGLPLGPPIINIANITLTGIIQVTLEQSLSLQKQFFSLSQGLSRDNLLFVQNISAFFQHDNLKSHYKYNDLSIIDFISYKFDLDTFNSFNLGSAIVDFEKHAIYLDNRLFVANIQNFYVQDHITDTLRELENVITQLIISLLIFVIPLILIAILLAYYSFGLIQRRKLLELNVYFTRGISKIQYISFLLLETIISLSVAIIGGILLSLPISSIIIQSSDFIEFNRPIAPVLLFQDLVQFVALYGLFIVFLVNLFKIIWLSKLSGAQIQQEVIEPREEPFWKRRYIDFILLGFGIVFYLLSLYSSNLDAANVSPFIFTVLAVPAPIFIIVGFVLTASRAFPIITRRLASYLWENHGYLFTFSLINVARRSKSVSQSIILTSLTLAFLISFLIFPFSFLEFQESEIRYNTGADIYIELKSSQLNYSYFDWLLSNYTLEIDAYTPILKTRFAEHQLMVINTSTFVSAAWMRDDFISDFEKSIESLSDGSNSILIYKENLVVTERAIGEDFIWGKFNLPTGKQFDFIFTPRATFTYWPRLLEQLPNNPRATYYGVISLQTYINLKNELTNITTAVFRSELLGLYVNVNDLINHTQFIEQISSNEGVRFISSITKSFQTLKSETQYLTIVSQINNNILYLFGINIILLGMFSYMQMTERKKEIATERALGTTAKQKFTLFTTEALWIQFFSICIGIISGIFFSSLFLLGFTMNQSFPPFAMIFPLDLFSIVIGANLILTIFFSYFITKISSDSKLEENLKVE